MSSSPTRSLLRREWHLYAFVVPSLVFVLTFSYYPALSAAYHSFFDWQGGDVKRLTGWKTSAAPGRTMCSGSLSGR